MTPSLPKATQKGKGPRCVLGLLRVFRDSTASDSAALFPHQGKRSCAALRHGRPRAARPRVTLGDPGRKTQGGSKRATGARDPWKPEPRAGGTGHKPHGVFGDESAQTLRCKPWDSRDEGNSPCCRAPTQRQDARTPGVTPAVPTAGDTVRRGGAGRRE